ncbi:MAG: hypothetical protein AAF889_10170, partial [Cyanobacteria bacterium P01_D01_bin.73]
MSTFQGIFCWSWSDCLALLAPLRFHAPGLLADFWTGRELWLRPICFVVAWGLVGALISNLF